VKRRDILKGAALAGAAVPGSLEAAQQTPHHPAAAAAASKTAPAAWKPQLFDAHQNETVATLAELIIPKTDTPGAREAKVNEYIDLILHDGPADRRNRFISGLGWLDGYAIRQHQAPFVRLTPAQQTGILKSLDRTKEADLRAGGEFFRQIKQLTVQGYYTSKVGIDELNKGGRVPGSFGCSHGGQH
jgi:hypothetical protein